MERRATIPGLTGLRGLAALWVVLFHLTDGMGPIPIVRNGSLGVDVFFILSGFVLAHVYADTLKPNDVRGYLNFLRARVARIYPLHLVLLLILGLVVLALPGFASAYPFSDQRFGAGAFVASLLLIQNWVHWLPTCWNAPAWSLSAEWFAYLTFPITLALTQRWRTQVGPLVLAFASLAVFVALMMVKGLADPNVAGDPGMLRMICEFVCGCLLFRANANGLRPLPRLAEAAALAVFLVSILCGRLVFLALPAIAAIVLITAQNRGVISHVLSARPVMFLGNISYSLYMVHWTIINLAHWAMPVAKFTPSQILLFDSSVLSVILGVSMLTFRLIEVPARAWGRRVGRRAAVSQAVMGALTSDLLKQNPENLGA